MNKGWPSSVFNCVINGLLSMTTDSDDISKLFPFSTFSKLLAGSFVRASESTADHNSSYRTCEFLKSLFNLLKNKSAKKVNPKAKMQIF